MSSEVSVAGLGGLGALALALAKPKPLATPKYPPRPQTTNAITRALALAKPKPYLLMMGCLDARERFGFRPLPNE